MIKLIPSIGLLIISYSPQKAKHDQGVSFNGSNGYHLYIRDPVGGHEDGDLCPPTIFVFLIALIMEFWESLKIRPVDTRKKTKQQNAGVVRGPGPESMRHRRCGVCCELESDAHPLT